MKQVIVRLGERSYSINVGSGLLSNLNKVLEDCNLSKKGVLITDSNVRTLYADSLSDHLIAKGFEIAIIEIPAGEPSKSIEAAHAIWQKLLELRCDRNSFILTVGGGVVGDLGGFVASTFLRGIPFVQVPTSLLAQVDSSVGGKVGINLPEGKNLIGSFYQPRSVQIDIEVLKTLPEREFKSGLAEVVKYGMIWDHSFFDYLNENMDALLKLDPKILTYAIAKSCEIKAMVVEMDEKELGMRAVLNFGHTFGHAYEATDGYKNIRHGEAIAVGMIAAARLSHKMELCREDEAQTIQSLIKKAGLPVKVKGLSFDQIKKHMQVDKKAQNGQLKFILLEKIGKVVQKTNVPENLLDEVIQESIDA